MNKITWFFGHNVTFHECDDDDDYERERLVKERIKPG